VPVIPNFETVCVFVRLLQSLLQQYINYIDPTSSGKKRRIKKKKDNKEAKSKMIFILLMGAGAWCVLFAFIPVIVALFIPIRHKAIIQWRRRYLEAVGAYWFRFATYLTLDTCGTHMSIHAYDPKIMEDSGNVGLVISNHRTRVDWMYVGWCYSSMINAADHLTIILKDPLRSVPIFGWATQLLMFIFLSRNRDADVPHIVRMLNYLYAVEARPSVLIFPEGTDLSPENLEKSNAFAKEQKLAETKQVLYPKVSGLYTCVCNMRGKGLLLHDITIAYKDHTFGSRHCEGDLMRGALCISVFKCAASDYYVLIVCLQVKPPLKLVL
jgi:1-acyl-sn-glycerol-3-phosphate acyltransferase